MGFYEGYLFFFCLAAALIPAIILGLLKKPIRFYSLFLSLVFIVAVFGKTPMQLLYLAIYYLWELSCVFGYLYLKNKHGRKEKIYYGMLLLTILPLLLSKLTPFIGGSIFCFLGISYLTFKSAQMVIEIYDGIIKEVSWLEFTGFLLFFPSISSGPIDRSRRFHEDWNKTYERSEYLELLGDGLLKLLLGVVYKLVLAAHFKIT